MSAEDRSPEHETFGRRIQQLRRDRGLTQRQLAAVVGLDFTYLSKLENNRGEPPGEETVRKLAKVLVEPGEDVVALTEELLAQAGKVPAEIKARASRDVEFARFLRRLPAASDTALQEIYDRLKSPPEP
ncbi:MAG: helix-turn-helix domain-containing protein [Pseudonocardiaceae bacterium]